jgi:hypothetical protein
MGVSVKSVPPAHVQLPPELLELELPPLLELLELPLLLPASLAPMTPPSPQLGVYSGLPPQGNGPVRLVLDVELPWQVTQPLPG